jgi:hypothetical protein
MNRAFCFLFSHIVFGSILSAQKFDDLDKSPMDMVYYPDNYAHDRKFAPQLIGTETAIIRILYSRPAKKEREIFGKLIPYGKVWRTGANEAPELKLYRDLTLGGKPVKAGTYALFTIPDQTEWTIIISSDLDQWGAYSYTENKDVLRFKVPVKQTGESVENFSIRMEKKDDHIALMRLAWDRTMIEIPFEW